MEERRKHARLSVMKNVGEPIELQVIKNHKKVSIPGFILNLSAGGMKMITLGDQAEELSLGAPFMMDMNLPGLHTFNIEGKIVSIQRGEKAKLHHTGGEWFLGISFTKIKPGNAHLINQLAEDWSICETKLQMQLPDICFEKCHCFAMCEKPVKLQSNQHA